MERTFMTVPLLVPLKMLLRALLLGVCAGSVLICGSAGGLVIEDVAPVATCWFGGSTLPCVGAQYPAGLQPPRALVNESVTFFSEKKCCSVESTPPGIQSGALVVRRGGCSFAAKAAAAWGAGWQGLVLVDHPVGNTAIGDATPATPNLQGLEAPASPPTPRSPPSVVMVSDAVARHSGLLSPAPGAGGVEEPDTPLAGARLAVSWAGWAASDPASLYYDGVRLGKAGRFAEAAEAHRKAAEVTALPHPPLPCARKTTLDTPGRR